jgi:pantothenate kinase
MKQLKIKQQTLNGSKPEELCVIATGGGAYKFYDKIREALGVDVLREDEMECLIIGTKKLSPCQSVITWTNMANRPRFLYYRDTPRGVHV